MTGPSGYAFRIAMSMARRWGSGRCGGGSTRSRRSRSTANESLLSAPVGCAVMIRNPSAAASSTPASPESRLADPCVSEEKETGWVGTRADEELRDLLQFPVSTDQTVRDAPPRGEPARTGSRGQQQQTRRKDAGTPDSSGAPRN